MKFQITYEREQWATVEVEAETFEEAEAKAKSDDVMIDESQWSSGGYLDWELCTIEDAEGNEQYYG